MATTDSSSKTATEPSYPASAPVFLEKAVAPSIAAELQAMAQRLHPLKGVPKGMTMHLQPCGCMTFTCGKLFVHVKPVGTGNYRLETNIAQFYQPTGRRFLQLGPYGLDYNASADDIRAAWPEDLVKGFRDMVMAVLPPPTKH